MFIELWMVLTLFRHCAKAVISMAAVSNVPGEVNLPVAALARRWVQSGTRDFDLLVGSTMNPKWMRAHQPVVSTVEHGHILYTEFLPSEFEGKLVLCPGRCKVEIEVKVRKDTVKHMCHRCKMRTNTPLIKSDKSTPLGYLGIRKVAYPREIHIAEWKLSTGPAIPTPPLKSPYLTTPASSTSAFTTPSATPPPSTDCESDLAPQPGPSRSANRQDARPTAAKRQRRR